MRASSRDWTAKAARTQLVDDRLEASAMTQCRTNTDRAFHADRVAARRLATLVDRDEPAVAALFHLDLWRLTFIGSGERRPLVGIVSATSDIHRSPLSACHQQDPPGRLKRSTTRRPTPGKSGETSYRPANPVALTCRTAVLSC